MKIDRSRFVKRIPKSSKVSVKKIDDYTWLCNSQWSVVTNNIEPTSFQLRCDCPDYTGIISKGAYTRDLNKTTRPCKHLIAVCVQEQIQWINRIVSANIPSA